MEEVSRSLEEKEKTLDERVKILEEKVVIQGLEEHNQMMLNAVKDLEAKVCELEKRLTKVPQEPVTFKPPKEPAPEEVEERAPEEEEPALEVTETVREEEPIEGEVTVAAIEEPEISEQPVEDSRKHEKKKRRLF